MVSLPGGSGGHPAQRLSTPYLENSPDCRNLSLGARSTECFFTSPSEKPCLSSCVGGMKSSLYRLMAPSLSKLECLKRVSPFPLRLKLPQ